jgi:hypothetical protein
MRETQCHKPSAAVLGMGNINVALPHYEDLSICVYDCIYCIHIYICIYIWLHVLGRYSGDIFQDYLLMSSPRFSVQKVSDTQ